MLRVKSPFSPEAWSELQAARTNVSDVRRKRSWKVLKREGRREGSMRILLIDSG